MNRRLVYPLASGLIALAALALALPAASPAEDDAGTLVKKAVEALPKVPFRAKLKLSPDQATPRDLELAHKLVGGARASYLEVLAPDELEGIRFLFLERIDKEPEQYIKIASARNAVQVKDQVRKQPFLESAFYISDLVEPDLSAFTYEYVGDEEVLGRKAKLVAATPKRPAEEIYGKMILAIDPTDLLILRRQFFDKKGAPLKMWTVDKVEKVDGIWTIRDQRMENVQDKTKARLETPEISYSVQLTDSMFAPAYLHR